MNKDTVKSKPLQVLPQTRFSLLEKAKNKLFIPIVSSYVKKPGLDLFPIDEFKDIVILVGTFSSCVVNKKFGIIDLIKKAIKAYQGYSDIPNQILDMTEDELLECYSAFRESFDIADDKIEEFVEDIFVYSLGLILSTIKFIFKK